MRHLAIAIRRAENVRLRRHHHLIEGLREHRRGEKGDCAQRVLAGVFEIVTHWRRHDEDAARSHSAGRAIIEIKLSDAGDDVLGLFGGVGMPAEPTARLDLVDDRGARSSFPESTTGFMGDSLCSVGLSRHSSDVAPAPYSGLCM